MNRFSRVFTAPNHIIWEAKRYQAMKLSFIDIKQGGDCGPDHEFLIAKFRCKLKKVGKTTISFKYDLNQIP